MVSLSVLHFSSIPVLGKNSCQRTAVFQWRQFGELIETSFITRFYEGKQLLSILFHCFADSFIVIAQKSPYCKQDEITLLKLVRFLHLVLNCITFDIEQQAKIWRSLLKLIIWLKGYVKMFFFSIDIKTVFGAHKKIPSLINWGW